MRIATISFILFFCFLCKNVNSQDQPTPNIIIMYSDDHTAQSIGPYQNVLNHGLKLYHTPTPNIDRLAGMYVTFAEVVLETGQNIGLGHEAFYAQVFGVQRGSVNNDTGEGNGPVIILF